MVVFIEEHRVEEIEMSIYTVYRGDKYVFVGTETQCLAYVAGRPQYQIFAAN